MNDSKTTFYKKLLYSYIIACYCSRIPSYFIDWRKGLPPEGEYVGWIEEIYSFILFIVLVPVITPLILFAETCSAFVWGDIMFERLLPLLTFTVTFVVSCFTISVMNRKACVGE